MTIYLDYNSTTPVSKEVLTEMLPYFSEQFGNPSSIHSSGQKALHALDLARTRVAGLLSAKPDEIYFTGSGTEADNLAIYGYITNNPNKKHIITSSVEHSAIYNTCKTFENKGIKVTYLPVDNNGIVSIRELEKVITKNTGLISIMLANNETGTIQDIKEIARIAEKHKITLHTDAVQAAGKMKLSVNDLGVDMLSISGHKIYGPKGIGALYIRRGLKISPLITGGGQEKKVRAGTENVPAIVGLGKACEIAEMNLNKNIIKLKELRDRLENGILENCPCAVINGKNAERTPNTSNISFLGTENESLIVKMDLNGIAASTGSACGANDQTASRTLSAMGLSYKELYSAIRFSIGINNTPDEIDSTIKVISKLVK